MSTVTLGGNPVHTTGQLPKVGQPAPPLTLTANDLSEVTLANWSTRRKVLNIFPSIDTGTCAASVRRFNQEATKLDDVVVVNVSADLPFAQKRFCGAEGITHAQTASTFRSSFAKDYGLEFADGPMRGLCSRAVLVLDGANRVIHAEQVAEIAREPDYEAALKVLR